MNILLAFPVKANTDIILVSEIPFFFQLLEMKHPSSADHHSFCGDNLPNNKLKNLANGDQINYGNCV